MTDRCNFRCRYCMPRETLQPGTFLPRGDILAFEEIAEVATVAVALGVEKLRLTGGEPLLRRELPRLVGMLSALPVDLAMTTNAVLLPRYARALADAGLGRLTVSLDALDEGTFQKMADAPGFSVEDVLAGISAAESAGFSSVKINCVVRRGVNDDQVPLLVEHFRGSAHILRFIEFMDVGTRNEWEQSEVVTQRELMERLGDLGELQPLDTSSRGQVAERYEMHFPRGDQLQVGFISSVSEPFCGTCTRARLSADGRIFTCLFGSKGHDLRPALRGQDSRKHVTSSLADVWADRGDRYSELRSIAGSKVHLPMARVEMSYIGG